VGKIPASITAKIIADLEPPAFVETKIVEELEPKVVEAPKSEL